MRIVFIYLMILSSSAFADRLSCGIKVARALRGFEAKVYPLDLEICDRMTSDRLEYGLQCARDVRSLRVGDEYGSLVQCAEGRLNRSRLAEIRQCYRLIERGLTQFPYSGRFTPYWAFDFCKSSTAPGEIGARFYRNFRVLQRVGAITKNDQVAFFRDRQDRTLPIERWHFEQQDWDLYLIRFLTSVPAFKPDFVACMGRYGQASTLSFDGKITVCGARN